ncbi:oxidative stress-induced growth inhibitor 1-like isoform X2 [Neocloeon triangulifer]|nr:oxidative stress-induced growth inhibitor 1-like isoform X2 [Neocloeon triangulifer]
MRAPKGTFATAAAQHAGLPQGTVHKQVVIVGNGPSGIALSHMLNGNWPYYNGQPHPTDEDLTARLAMEPQGLSIVEQDLQFLSQGLEGRSNNAVSLLFDCLNLPCADLGVDSEPLLGWQYHPDKYVDHVVLGKGPPGGSWQTMDGSVLTISLSRWMELPGLDFRCFGGGGPPICRDSRASVASLAKYYSDYVKLRHLQSNFRCGTIVTRVTPLPDNQWLISGVEQAGDEGAPDLPFNYVTSHLVLATGNCDRPNKLKVPGDSEPFVVYSLLDIERMVKQGKLGEHSDPVLVVGAGLSAADAIISCRFHGLPVLHAFRRSSGDPGFVFKQLPENMYPEYHKVHQMMTDGGKSYKNYRSLPEHKIIEIRPDNKVRLMGPGDNGSSACYVIKVSAVVALLGAQPDLDFMPMAGAGLGVLKDLPVASRSNPVHIDPFSYECSSAPGLYAIGSLAGDNLVRFVHGGALAFTSHIHKQMTSEANDTAEETVDV